MCRAGFLTIPRLLKEDVGDIFVGEDTEVCSQGIFNVFWVETSSALLCLEHWSYHNCLG